MTPTAAAQTFTTASTVANLVPAPSSTIKWYAAATGGTALPTTTAIATGNYYVSETNANGCESERTSVAITVNLVALPFVGQTFTFEGINYIVTKATLPYEVAVGNNRSFVGAAVIPNTATNNGYSFAVKSIANFAFDRCATVTSVTIPDSVIRIGDTAFYLCYNLTSVTIPNSVTSIGESTFLGCTSLTSVTIANSVTSIGELAFGGCTSLTSFNVNWSTPLSINPNVFDGVILANVTLNVPTGLEALYGSTNVWREFKSTTLGTNGYDNSSTLKFYPNPAQSQINFSQEIINLEVFDITGKKVKSFEKSSSTFDVSNLEKGVYILQGKTNIEKNIIQKMIKE
jgi:hypothetical protein